MNPITTVRVVAIMVAVAAAVLRAAPARAVDPLWEPQPVPAECRTVNVHLLLQDISGSMGRLLPVALEQQATYVEHVSDSDCVYLVYAEFGASAAVVADGFLVSDEERARVATEIRSRPRPQANTNFDEAAALVELTLLKVERSYTEVPWSFTTSVISDHIPDPSEGHQPFDLQTYVAQRQLGAHVGVLRVELVGRGRVPSPDQVRSALGRISSPVGSLSEVLRAAVVPVDPATPVAAVAPIVLRGAPAPPAPNRKLGGATDPAGDRSATTSPASVERAPKENGARLGVGLAAPLVALVLAVLLGWFLIAWRRARREAEAVLGDTDVAQGAEVVPIKSPAGLRVTEWRVPLKGDRVLVNGPVAVRYTPNVPITLGSDEGHVLVALRTPGVSPRLASIVLDGRGNGIVTPLNGVLRFDGQEVQRRMVFAAEHPHVIAAGDVEVQIEAVSLFPETEDALYRRLARCSRGASPVTSAPAEVAPAGTEGDGAKSQLAPAGLAAPVRMAPRSPAQEADPEHRHVDVR